MEVKLRKILLRMSKMGIYVLILIQSVTMVLATESDAQRRSLSEITIDLGQQEASSMIDLVEVIESKSNFTFAYLERSLKKREIHLKQSYWHMDELLKEISIQARVSLRRVNESIAIINAESNDHLPDLIEKVDVQQTITGTVKDESGLPLPGATVLEKGTTNGTTTDISGKFQLSASEDAVLIVSFVGYETLEVSVSNRSVVDVSMILDSEQLEEVVVVGYGMQQKEDLTGSIASVGNEAIKDRPVNTLSQALAGKLAGVSISQTNATPGGSVATRIRGTGSITAGNEPLYVIDGYPTTIEVANSLFPGDIQSVNVLKDASATAIYGSRGSNGVIIITTKKGNTKKPSITLSSSLGLASVAKMDYYDLLTGSEYTAYAKELRNNQWVRESPGNSPDDPNNVRPAQFQIPDELENWNGINTDWQDAIFESALIQNHNISASGGSGPTTYMMSIGLSSDDGVVIGTGYEKYTANIKVDSEVIPDKLKIGMNLLPSYSSQQVAKGDGTSIYESVIASAIAMPPNKPVFNVDGSYADRMIPMDGFLPIPNPVQLAKEIENYNRTFSNLFSSYLEYSVLDNLVLKTSFGFTYRSGRNRQYHPTTAPRFWEDPPVTASGSVSSFENINWLSETTVNYRKQINENHRIDFLIGFTAQKDRYDYNNLSANNFPNDLVKTLNAGEITGGSSFIEEWSLLSTLGRFNYDFKSKYLFTATFRGDGSSRFGANNKWGYFPSVAVAWRLSEESFMSNMNPIISDAKIRSSYGVTGNNNIGNYSAIPLLAVVNQSFGSGPGSIYSGIRPTGIGNPGLGWERSKQLDLGLDLEFLSGAIGVTIDYYRNRTSDLLLQVPLPTITGFSSSLQNVGEVENRGFELVLTHETRVGNLIWSSSVNLAMNENEVIKLGPSGDPLYGFFGTRITAVGGPVGAANGLLQIGVLTQEDIDNGVPIFPGQTAGDVKYLDRNGDGEIGQFNGPDGQSIGAPLPKYVYGLTSTLEFKNFDFTVFLQGQSGGKTSDFTSQGLWDPDGSNILRNWWEGRYISDENPGDGMTPRAGLILGGFPDSRLVHKTDFFRIRNITLGYNIRSNGGVFSNARIYASIENVITWSKFEGYNPQALSYNSGNDATISGLTGGGSYPIPRVSTLGFSLTF